MEKKPLTQLSNQERILLILNCSAALFLTLLIKALPAQILNPNAQAALAHPVLILCALQALVFSLNNHKLNTQHFLYSIVSLVAISTYSQPSFELLLCAILSLAYIFLVHEGCLKLFNSTFSMTLLLSLDFVYFLYAQLLGKEDIFLPLSLFGFLLQPSKIMNASSYLFLIIPAAFLLHKVYQKSLSNNNNSST